MQQTLPRRVVRTQRTVRTENSKGVSPPYLDEQKRARTHIHTYKPFGTLVWTDGAFFGLEKRVLFYIWRTFFLLFSEASTESRPVGRRREAPPRLRLAVRAKRRPLKITAVEKITGSLRAYVRNVRTYVPDSGMFFTGTSWF